MISVSLWLKDLKGIKWEWVVMFFSSYNGKLKFLFFSENIALVASVFVAALIKVGSAGKLVDLHLNLGKALFAAIVFQVCLYFCDLYDLSVRANRVELARRLVAALLAATLILGGLYTIFPKLMVIPGIWIWNAVIALVTIYFWRMWVEKINSIPSLGSTILIVGTGRLAEAIASELTQRSLGVRVCGYLCEENGQLGATINKHRVIGTIDDLESVVARHHVSHIVVALSDRRGRLPVDTLLQLKMSGVTIETGESLFEQVCGKLPVEQLNPSYLVFSNGFKVSKLTSIYKRTFSIIFSLIGLVFSAPLMVLTAIAIKLDSRGPVFFTQERVGKDGRAFKLIKFRSMRVDAEAGTGPVWATNHDPRVTRVGRFIRRTRIDEIPQFINVLKGDMHFVGPRPERPFFVEQLRSAIPYYGQRHTVEPGLTGWAQVCYPYGSTIEESREKLKYDLYYIKNMSIFFDLLIIFQTVKIVLLGRGAR